MKLFTSILILLSFSAVADDRYWDNYRAERQNQAILRQQRNMQMQMEYNQNMQNGYQMRQNQESRREREAREQYERDQASGFYQ
jgi:hypothetical protein